MINATITNVSERYLVREYNDEFRSQVWPVTTWFGLLMISGIISNILIMYMFFLHYKPCNFRLFVLSLAWTDFISCLTAIPAEIVSLMFWFDYYFPAVCKTKAFFNQYTVFSEAASLTIIAIDRHRKLCRPFGWQISCKAAFFACVVIHMVSALLAIPTPIFWGVTTKEHVYKNRNITVSLCEKDVKYERTPYPLVNTTVNGSIVSVSLLLMFVLYILVARRLICSRGDRSNYSREQMQLMDLIGCCLTVIFFKREMMQCRTLIGFCLTIIFIVTTVLFLTLISNVPTGILDRLHGGSAAVFFFFLRLYFINHVIKPILYGILDPQFRIAMKCLKQKMCG